MTCERCLDRCRCSLHVSNFAEHDDIRVLTQQGLERAGHADLFVHLCLRDAFEVVFDRILNGRDVHRVSIKLLQTRVQRCRLTRTSRTRHKHDAVRLINQMLPRFVRVVGETKVGQLHLDRLRIENTNNRFFHRARWKC